MGRREITRAFLFIVIPDVVLPRRATLSRCLTSRASIEPATGTGCEDARLPFSTFQELLLLTGRRPLFLPQRATIKLKQYTHSRGYSSGKEGRESLPRAMDSLRYPSPPPSIGRFGALTPFRPIFRFPRRERWNRLMPMVIARDLAPSLPAAPLPFRDGARSADAARGEDADEAAP